MMSNSVYTGATKTSYLFFLLAQIVSLTAMGFFGLIAGFFYAYSVDVMPGLDLIEPETAVSAMQGINIAVRNPVFFTTFFGTPVIGLFTAFCLFVSGQRLPGYFMAMASAVYIFGAFLPTASINVPMNEALAVIPLESSLHDYLKIWSNYSLKWTFWNSFRTIASLVALLISGLALLRIGTIKR